MPLPFCVDIDKDLILQAVPSGFLINTKSIQIFIDGSTHQVITQEPQKGFTHEQIFALLSKFNDEK